MEQKEQKRCIGETALRGHYGGIVRRVVAITRQVREEQCKKQWSRFLHSSSLPARESIRVQTACIATCRALFAGWHLAAVYVAMHILSSTTRKVVSCSSTLLRSRSFLFPLLEGFTFASEDFFIRSSSSSSL